MSSTVAIIEAGENGKATLRELDAALAQLADDAPEKAQLQRLVASRKKSHRRALKEKVNQAASLNPDESIALYHQCAAELPPTDSVLSKIEQVVFARKRKKVLKSLESSLSLAQLSKLLLYCKQELAHDGTTIGKVQSAIDDREASHGTEIRENISNMLLQAQGEMKPSVRSLEALVETASRELPPADESLESVRVLAQQRRETVINKIENALAEAEASGPASPDEIRNVLEECREQLPSSDATLLRVERLFERHQSSNEMAIGASGSDEVRLRVGAGEDSANRVKSRKSRESRNGKRRSGKRNRDSNSSSSVLEFLNGIKHDLSGINDSTSTKIMITTMFLLYMAVTLYTVQLALKISPFEVSEDIDVSIPPAVVEATTNPNS